MIDGIAIPAHWAWATFDQVAEVACDLTDPTLTPDAYHVAPNHVESGTGRLLPFTTVAADGVSSPKHRFRSGQIVYSKIRPYLAKAILATFDGLCSADMYPVNSFIQPKYLLHWLLSPWFTAQTARNQGRTILPKINQVALGRLFVPVPPINEQERIVETIDELLSDIDAGVAALERARANLKRYRAAVLKAAVEGRLTEQWRAEHPATEPASQLLERILAERRRKWEADQLAKYAAAGKTPPKNWQAKYAEPTPPDTTGLPELPRGWCWARMDQLIGYLRNGFFKSPMESPDGVRILRINAVRPMRVDLDEVRLQQADSDELDGYFVENGDLLFTRYNGSVDLLGVCGMVRGCDRPTVHPDKLIRVQAVLPQPLPTYLEIACNWISPRMVDTQLRV
jgi:type I restriction enzyme S subunit